MGGGQAPARPFVKLHRLIIRSGAERDIATAIGEYEGIATGLGGVQRTDPVVPFYFVGSSVASAASECG